MKNLTSVVALLGESCMRRGFALMLLALLALLSACGTMEVTSPPRPARELATKVLTVEDRNNAPWCGVNRSGLRSRVAPHAAGEMTGGFDNFYDPGTQPIACDHQISHVFVSAFSFDLSDLRGKFITGARLHLQRRETNVPIAIERVFPTGRRTDRECLINLEMATESFVPGFEDRGSRASGIDSIPLRPEPVQLDSAFGLVGVGRSVRIAVSDWVAGRRPNFGFVIKPMPSSVAKNNNSCTGYYYNPTLEITYLDRPPEGP